MNLFVDPDELATCIQCGLCLPHCPTYRISGDEVLSPRGRIRLMVEINEGNAPVTPEVIDAFATCIQCRGCEPACPSGVPYGKLIEGTNEALVAHGITRLRLMRVVLWGVSRPRLLRFVSSLLAIAARARLVPGRFGIPRNLPIRRAARGNSGDDVYLFTGCVMDAWQREVHHATQRVLEASGVGVTLTGDSAPCCGALHHHAGLVHDARRRATATMTALGHDDRPILVNSAGCGAALKGYGDLLDSNQARAFSARVFDVHEWLASRLDDLPTGQRLPVTVAVQDPCHLRHVQQVHVTVRDLLAPYVQAIVELDDDGLCCGAGGAYAVRQPEPAAALRDRKLAVIARTEADLVTSANPGCSLHLAAGGLIAPHPMQLVDWALHGGFPG